ncbi:BNR repeat-containing protein [Paenibacillus glycanilyticus]|uniref:BNR repeat-containing protein n=1 Tax=Paenibacillus glycanilyticus TaxID=126569 RepID=UPI000FD99D5D|nr:BNR repeat-containing protein [Paenibacillus glycanilyticus]
MNAHEGETTYIENNISVITNDGAWCWFADPRAIRNVNAETGSDKTYIGYIDVAGNIQALQYDNTTNEQDQVLVRAGFQADDHNNPTFLILPDGRIMIFYSEHSTTPYFYYRITSTPDDIKTLGSEKTIDTKGYGNTTYPSAFILADKPEYFYLLWRGINWSPTIARFKLPDQNGDVVFDRIPKQIVDARNDYSETGKRPYAKYVSDGKNKIFMTFTYTHPDDSIPNSLYFSYLDINTFTLHDAQGNMLADVNKEPLKLTNEENDPSYLIDRRLDMRNWNWDLALDKEGQPVTLFVRVNKEKDSHHYYYAKWTGSSWRLTELADAGRWFHLNERKECCYSGGMILDHANPSTVYMSKPVEGQHGSIFEILKCDIAEDGSITNLIPITKNSAKNNVRPFVVRNASPDDRYYLIWMHGDYYYWDHSQGKLGYTTGLRTLSN